MNTEKNQIVNILNQYKKSTNTADAKLAASLPTHTVHRVTPKADCSKHSRPRLLPALANATPTPQFALLPLDVGFQQWPHAVVSRVEADAGEVAGGRE